MLDIEAIRARVEVCDKLPEDAPALLAEVDRLRAVLGKIRDVVSWNPTEDMRDIAREALKGGG